MRNRIALVAPAAVILLAAPLAIPAAPPDARALIEGVSRTYRGLQSYHFQGTVTVRMMRGTQVQAMDFPLTAAAQRPGRVRNEFNTPSMGMAYVSDGKQTYTYYREVNQYTRTPATSSLADTGAAMAGTGSPLTRYFDLANGLKSARWVRVDTLVAGGRRSECDLVEAEFEHPIGISAEYSPTSFWIERGRSLVLRESTSVQTDSPEGGKMRLDQTTAYTLARVNAKLPDTLFTFRPPADAKEVSSFGTSQAVDLSGKPAMDFSLQDLAGKPVRLSSLRGKVVLLDFWATWCGPCRIEMPNLQKLHDAFKNKGLVVLGVDYGEEPAKVKPFLEKNKYTFRILLDRDQSVGQNYQVSGIPTLFIIDKTGTIRSHFVGVRSETVLREALAAAGIK